MTPHGKTEVERISTVVGPRESPRVPSGVVAAVLAEADTAVLIPKVRVEFTLPRGSLLTLCTT